MDLPGWQVLREELHPLGLEVVTVGLEMGGAEVLRPYVEAAHAEHPSLVDQNHQMDAVLGVTNIPSAIWIDEQGTIVRPPELCAPPPVPGSAGDNAPPAEIQTPAAVPALVTEGMSARAADPQRYANRIRDWVRLGPQSHYALSPEEVVARSRPRPVEVSQAAAHFELAQYLWHLEGFSESTLRHFEAAHTLQPDNITYKRQAYSAYSFERGDGNELSRFQQGPRAGDEWPFVSDYDTDMAGLRTRSERERAARRPTPG
jgi:hypothetical protein